MKENAGIPTARLTVIAALFFALSFFSACGKEPSQEKSTARAVSTYSSDSVFNELQDKLRKDPNDAESLYHLADLYDRNAQYAEAIDAYKKTIKIKPDMGYAYVKMGTAYDRLNRPADAVTAFRQALKYLPSYPVIYNNMGVAYGKLGKLNEEIAALKKAVQLRASYSSAHYNLGMAYFKKGDKGLAMREYEDLKSFDEGSAAMLLKEIKGGR